MSFSNNKWNRIESRFNFASSRAAKAARENIINTAKQAEEKGFDSLWVFERLLWPINPQSPYVATPDGSLPVEYQEVLDPLATLTYLASKHQKY